MVEPRFNDLWYNDIPSLVINIPLPSKSYSKMYWAQPRYNHLQYNNIPGLAMGMSLTKCKIFPVIHVMIKSISQTTGNANIPYYRKFKKHLINAVFKKSHELKYLKRYNLKTLTRKSQQTALIKSYPNYEDVVMMLF